MNTDRTCHTSHTCSKPTSARHKPHFCSHPHSSHSRTPWPSLSKVLSGCDRSDVVDDVLDCFFCCDDTDNLNTLNLAPAGCSVSKHQDETLGLINRSVGGRSSSPTFKKCSLVGLNSMSPLLLSKSALLDLDCTCSPNPSMNVDKVHPSSSLCRRCHDADPLHVLHDEFQRAYVKMAGVLRGGAGDWQYEGLNGAALRCVVFHGDCAVFPAAQPSTSSQRWKRGCFWTRQ